MKKYKGGFDFSENHSIPKGMIEVCNGSILKVFWLAYIVADGEVGTDLKSQ